jgi:hypothetical protein
VSKDNQRIQYHRVFVDYCAIDANLIDIRVRQYKARISRRESMGMITKVNGKLIRKGARSFLTEASPDDPIYKRGWFVGGYFSKDSLSTTREKTSRKDEKDKEQLSKENVEL